LISVDVAVDASGNLYVADPRNHRVQMYDSSLVYVRTYGETGVPYLTDGYHYNSPYDVAVSSSGKIAIVEDWGRGQRLIALDADGEPLFIIGEPEVSGDDNEHFAEPKGVAFDATGRLYVADCGNARVQIFDSAGMWIARIGTGMGTGNYEFDCPSGVTVDTGGNIYVADSGNHRVQIYDSSRMYLATIGTTGVSGSDNAHFNGLLTWRWMAMATSTSPTCSTTACRNLTAATYTR
jgi:tripartite motif-containing protein 71